jgi:hypothetical protein
MQTKKIVTKFVSLFISILLRTHEEKMLRAPVEIQKLGGVAHTTRFSLCREFEGWAGLSRGFSKAKSNDGRPTPAGPGNAPFLVFWGGVLRGFRSVRYFLILAIRSFGWRSASSACDKGWLPSIAGFGR